MAGGYMPAIARDAVLQEAVHLDLRVRRHMLLNIPVSIPLNIPANTRFSMVVKLLFLAIPVKPHLRIALNIKANIPAKLQEAVDLNIPVNMRVSTQVNMVFRR